MGQIARFIVVAALVAGLAPMVGAQEKKEAPKEEAKSSLPLDVRANAAFEKKDYETALPLLMILASNEKDAKKGEAIQEKIRVCQTALQAAATPQDLQDMAGVRPEEETSPEKRKKHPQPKDGQAYEVNVRELGNFQYDAERGGNIPEDVMKLNGAKLRTRGFMIPLDQADNITEFALVPSLFACCFGQPPQIQHTMIVKTPKGKAVSYFPEEIIVEGTLKIEERKEDDVIVSVFEMECLSVKPAAK